MEVEYNGVKYKRIIGDCCVDHCEFSDGDGGCISPSVIDNADKWNCETEVWVKSE